MTTRDTEPTGDDPRRPSASSSAAEAWEAHTASSALGDLAAEPPAQIPDPPARPPEDHATEVPAPPTTTAPAPGATWDPRLGRWDLHAGATQTVFPPPARRSGPTMMRAAIAGGIIGAVLASGATFGVVRLSPGPERVVERRLEPPGAIGSSGGGGSIVDIAARARPWVVNVNVEGRRPGLFGQNIVQGTGSGVIIRSDGHIITNAHVVEDPTAIEVTLASGDRVPAELVGADVDTDVAVLKIDRDALPSAVIGSVAEIEVGDLAIAIGSPLGLQQTVTAGIVSALGRTVDRQGLPPLVDMVQTDAAITQGNSGGALIDGNGALIGINTAIAASPDVGAEGIAFAIPIDIAKRVADELIATGEATYPWLGIQGGNIDAETARQFGIGEGALVIEVVPGSPAAQAGLRVQDVVVDFNGEAIESMNELVVEIRKRAVGDDVTIGVVRDGDRVELTTTLADKPDGL